MTSAAPSRLRSIARRHPFATFVVLAFAWTWPLAAAIEVSLALPLLGLFGPLIGATVVVAALGGRPGVRDLYSRFRVGVRDLPWLLAAALLPLALLVPVWALGARLGGPAELRLAPLSAVSFVLAVLIVGEEVGWRGFALPHLLGRTSPVYASLGLGVVWALWHLPNFVLPGYPHRGLPFAAFLLLVVAYSVLFTAFALRTRGNLAVAVVLHAALNLFSVDGLDPARQHWLKAAVYGGIAVLLLVLLRRPLRPPERAG
jgi:uncharacterized protein